MNEVAFVIDGKGEVLFRRVGVGLDEWRELAALLVARAQAE